MGAEPSFLYGARGFEPEEPASDDRAARDARASSHDRVQVLDGAVDEDAFEFDAGKAWHEGRRTRRDHHVIVGNSLAARGLDEPELTIDPRRLHTDAELDAAIAVPRLVGEAELVGGGRGEVARELHAIVGGAGLLAQHGDAEASARVEGSDLFAEAMAHHAVADDDDARCVRFDLISHDGVPKRRWSGLRLLQDYEDATPLTSSMGGR